MNAQVRRLFGMALALAAVLSIAVLSRVPYAAADSEQALIRFSWRTPGVQVEDCRTLSAEEQQRQPVHMRRDRVCERRIPPYRLVVHVDGTVVFDEQVRPAGAREDRPLYVLRDLPIGPGEHRVKVLWEREGASADEAGARLELDAYLRLAPGDVALVTYDVDRQRLAARGRGVVREEATTADAPDMETSMP